MRRRKQITPEQILAALEASDHDVEAAAALIRAEIGESFSSRTLRRRMADYGITRSGRYEAARAA